MRTHLNKYRSPTWIYIRILMIDKPLAQAKLIAN